jgi:hypothetical protein
MNSTPVTFTVTSSKAFPLDTTTINVWSHYGDTEVGLQADFSEPFPNFLQGLSQVDVE